MDLSRDKQSVHFALFLVEPDKRVKDGVYRAGFATQQAAYETAVKIVFAGLDKVEKILTGKDYLVGGRLTEADVRLWVTIVRCWNCPFATVYSWR
jgi:glutathionyl-hydroquinone reductase